MEARDIDRSGGGRSASSRAPARLGGEFGVPAEGFFETQKRRLVAFFLGEDPNFWVAMVPSLAVAALLFTRSLTTNFIFDEQEALLANPYVNGKNVAFLDVIHRDFWGLLPDRSVGSYRPLPNVLWRAIATGVRALHDLVARITHSKTTYALYPWVFHWVNVILHAANGAIMVCLVFHLTKRRGLSWVVGAVFLTCAV